MDDLSDGESAEPEDRSVGVDMSGGGCKIVSAPCHNLLSDSDDETSTAPVKQQNCPPPVPMPCSSLRTAEVFSGSGKLSKALERQGVHESLQIDLRFNPEHDMSSVVASQNLTQEMFDSGRGYVHVAVPCNTYSPARWPKLRSTTYPDGVPGALSNCDDSETLRVSNSVTHNALTMADRLMSRGVAVSVENPAASLFLDSLN